MLLKSHHHSTTRGAVIALAALLGAALSFPAHAADVWRLNMAKSSFGSGPNTLVLERSSTKQTSDAGEARDAQAPKRFLVISHGNVYVVTNATAAIQAGKDLKLVADSAATKGFDIQQIGENAQVADHCGFRCQAGLPEN